MPGRKHPLLTDNVYHVYNKTINGLKIFSNKRRVRRFLDVIWYYRSTESRLRYSIFSKLHPDQKEYYLEAINNKYFYRVVIVAYCLMPTHYHLLIRQNCDDGVSDFISLIQNSFTKYHNIQTKRNGPVFLHRFKSKPIITDEQYMHVSRYIHLNPYSSGIVRSAEELDALQYSSFGEYTGNNKILLTTGSDLLDFFQNKKNNYKKFVLNNADYQKMLEYCKYSEKWVC